MMQNDAARVLPFLPTAAQQDQLKQKVTDQIDLYSHMSPQEVENLLRWSDTPDTETQGATP